MANYDKRIYDLIQDIKNDKSITPKWRNKAMARFDEGQAFITTGQRETNIKPPLGMDFEAAVAGLQAPVSASNANQHVNCTCPPGMRNKSCPEHGDKP